MAEKNAAQIELAIDAAGQVDVESDEYTYSRWHENGVVQVEITGTAEVTLYGRATASAPWEVITTLSASGLVPFALMPRVKAKVTSYSSGSVNTWIIGK